MEKLELHIVFDPTNPEGALQVNGCIGAEPMALWMLEKAKDAIKEYCTNQQSHGHRIVTPTFVPNLNGGR